MVMAQTLPFSPEMSNSRVPLNPATLPGSAETFSASSRSNHSLGSVIAISHSLPVKNCFSISRIEVSSMSTILSMVVRSMVSGGASPTTSIMGRT